MLEKSFIIAFIVLGIHACFQKGMIFGWVQKGEGVVFPALMKIAFNCPVCQTPYWGSIAYWLIWAESWKEYIPVIICAMGINFLISFFLPSDD